jgi:cation-transporting ATPase 13A1
MFPLEGRSLSIFVVTLVFLILSFISVALRCFVRLRLVRAFGWDDSLMVLAMVGIFLSGILVVGE